MHNSVDFLVDLLSTINLLLPVKDQSSALFVEKFPLESWLSLCNRNITMWSMWKSFCYHGNIEHSYEKHSQNFESAKICVQSGKSSIKKEKKKNCLENDHKHFICMILLIFWWNFCQQSICCYRWKTSHQLCLWKSIL